MMREELKLKSDSESKRSASESRFAKELHPYPKMTRSFRARRIVYRDCCLPPQCSIPSLIQCLDEASSLLSNLFLPILKRSHEFLVKDLHDDYVEGGILGTIVEISKLFNSLLLQLLLNSVQLVCVCDVLTCSESGDQWVVGTLLSHLGQRSSRSGCTSANVRKLW